MKNTATTEMTAAERFFYDNAGYSYKADSSETPEQGKTRGARELARAEQYAKDNDWSFEWEEDIDGCIGCDCDDPECKCSNGEPHEVLCCRLLGEDGNVRQSLSGICEPTKAYGRVIEAELALEAMHSELSTAR